MAPNPISYSDILAYATIVCFGEEDRADLSYCLKILDAKYLEHYAKEVEKIRAQQEAQAKRGSSQSRHRR